MEQSDGVLREELFRSIHTGDARADVVDGVVGNERIDRESMVHTREERSIAPKTHSVVELRQADEDKGEERPAVPRVVEQDMEVVERVLVQEVGFIDKEDREQSLLRKLLDVSANRIEDVARCVMTPGQTEGEAELPIEIATSERHVMAIGEAKTIGTEGVPECSQEARLASTWLAGEQGALLSVHGIDELI